MLMRIAVLLAFATLLACGDETSTPLPCDVDRVVEQTCYPCHSAERAFGAEFSIVDWEDTRAPAPTRPQRAVWEEMQRRITAPDNPMPPVAVDPLTDEQRAVLDAWFAAGAPPGDPMQACP